MDFSFFTFVFPIVTVLGLLLFFRYYKRVTDPLVGTAEWITRVVDKPRFSFMMRRHPMTVGDILPLAAIMAVFTFFAFFNLGDTDAPQSFRAFDKTDFTVKIELAQETEISRIMFYTGLHTGHYELDLASYSGDRIPQLPKDDREFAMDQPYSHLFKWRTADLNDDNPPVKYIHLKAAFVPMELGEVAVFDSDGELIPVSHIFCEGAERLFDEQELVPERASYLNSMYFDEIYHGRTALEHLRNIYPYETTHPPLGKEIIAVGIDIFGMSPFGWRFMGALCGVLMLAVLYIFLKNMFGKTYIAICGTLLFGFDFMRFTQTRIATIDTYGVLFILLSYFFMYRYITTNPSAKLRVAAGSLALSGLFFGIGCASKWIVIYAGAGLAAIFFVHLVMQVKYYKANDMAGVNMGSITGRVIKTLICAALFFIVVPVIIYCLSYIPYGTAKGMSVKDGMLWNPEYYKIIWNNQTGMFSYHGKLTEGHPYASRWYQWIVDGRPILYFWDGNVAPGMKSAFAAFGNPVVWWGGLLAMTAMVYRFIKFRDSKALFIVIGYLSQFAPWLLISRAVFIYHYFPSVVFLTMAAAHIFNSMDERKLGSYKLAINTFTASAGVLFLAFYPAISGFPAPHWYFKYFLRWIPGAWPF